MMLTIPFDVSLKCYALLQILHAFDQFWYFDMFEDFIINRSVHACTLEGDGEKPSRHDNEGHLLFLFDVWWTSARDEHRRHLEIPKLRKGKKCLCWNISSQVKMNEKVIAHCKRTPAYTFFLFWISHSHFQNMGTRGREGANPQWLLARKKNIDFSRSSSPGLQEMFKIVVSWHCVWLFYNSVVFSPKCCALSEVLHSLDKVLSFLYLWGFYYP